MTENSTATTKAKTAKHAASSLIPNFEMPKFNLSNTEIKRSGIKGATIAGHHSKTGCSDGGVFLQEVR